MTRSKFNRSQQRAIDRVLSYFTRYVISTQADVYAMSHEVENIGQGPLISMTVRVKRTDCHEFSPRAVVCNDGGHFIIGQRGAIKVCGQYRLCGDRAAQVEHEKHVAFMVRGKLA